MAKAKNFEGKHIVLDEGCLNEREKSQENPEIFQIYLATGGFGCSSHTIGDKVFATQIATGKETHFRRHSVAGLATKTQVKAAQKFRESTKLYREISLDTIQFDDKGEAYVDITKTYRYDVSLIVRSEVGGIIDMSLDVDDDASSGGIMLDALARQFRQNIYKVEELLDNLGYSVSEQIESPEDEMLKEVWDTIREVKNLLSVQPTRKDCIEHLRNYARVWLASTLNLETLPPSVKVDLDALPEDVVKELAEKSPRVREFYRPQKTPEE